MRVYGRIVPDILYPDVTQWIVVMTDKNGYNDECYLTALIQCLKLNLGESPFYGNSGIPAEPSVVTQTIPNFYVSLTQQRYARYFASLNIFRIPDEPDGDGVPAPTWQVNVMFQSGATKSLKVAI